MGKVPGITFCPIEVVVILVPLQAAACDTAGAMKSKVPAFRPLKYASLVRFKTASGFSILNASTDRPQKMQLVHIFSLTSS